jgi:surface antigen
LVKTFIHSWASLSVRDIPLKSFILLFVGLSLLTACASRDAVGENGGLLGMAPVGNLSSDAVAVLGNLTGNPTARDLDEKDKAISADAVTAALQTNAAGKSSDWRNPDSGHSGEITPGPVYFVNDYSCRDYVHHIVIGDRQETLRSTACRQPDGTWRALI